MNEVVLNEVRNNMAERYGKQFPEIPMSHIKKAIIKLEGSRGHLKHIRLSKEISINFVEDFLKYKLQYPTKDSNYSSLYRTYKCRGVPVVLASERANKSILNSKDLTPNKLGLSGMTFNSVNDLMNEINNNLFSGDFIINHDYRSYKEEFADLFGSELSLKYMIWGLLEAYTSEDPFTEENLFFIHKEHNCLLKDLGEIIIALNELKKGHTVYFADTENEAKYDLIVNGEKVNCKSGSGSGQSLFNSITDKQAAQLTNKYKDNSLALMYIETIRIMSSSKPGYEKHWEVIDFFSNEYPEFRKIEKEFFNGHIKFENFNNKQMSYEEYTNKMFDILGSDLAKPQDKEWFEREEHSVLKSIMSQCLYYIDRNQNDKLFSEILSHLKPVNIIHIDFMDDFFKVSEPEKIFYKLHYWANAKAPINNLLGFKQVI